MPRLDRRQWNTRLAGFLAAAALPASRAAEPLKNVLALWSALRLPHVHLLEEGEFRAARAQGQVVVAYGWVSWCPFCFQVTPHIQKLRHAQRDRGLQVMGLSIDQDLAAAKAYRARWNYGSPSGWVTPAVEAILPSPRACPSRSCTGATAVWPLRRPANSSRRTWKRWHASSRSYGSLRCSRWPALPVSPG